MTIVYAANEGVIIWSGGDQLHKQGRVPKHEPLVIKREYAQTWYIIERPENLSLPANKRYPDYWVRRYDTIATPISQPNPAPEPGPMPEPETRISDQDAASALLLVLKWLKQ